jgi:small-conductance mechanosensitive channel
MSDQTVQVLGIGLEKLIYLAVVAIIALVVQHIVVRLARKALDASKIPSASIFINLLRALIWVIALLSVLQPVFGVEPTGFVAALGVTSVIISFGLQDTVSNVVGGLGLMGGKVIQPGDHVRIGDVSGVVTDITWRQTCVRDRLGNVDVIPNSQLNKTSLVRLSPMQACECHMPILVTPMADLVEVTADVERTLPEALGKSYLPEFGCQVRFIESGPYGVQADVLVHVSDDMSFSKAKDACMRALSGRDWLEYAEP